MVTRTGYAERINAYADALVALGRATNRETALQRELQQLVDAVAREPRLQRFLQDPAVRNAGKHEALERLFGREISDTLLHVLGILIAGGDLRHLPAVAAAYVRKASELKGKSAGEIVSAVPLPEATLAAIRRETAAVLGRPVTLRPRLDPALIGGVVVRVGDFVLDASVQRRLEEARRALLA
ncbi:MAG: ATP synthase F1 subunit delta [Lentisphaerae bacterium]|nr:ATP synthase F1 subunit delta [Lentisphaerota bacterium]